MMDPNYHAQTSGVMDLGISQMDQQIADAAIQYVVQRPSDLRDGVHVQSTEDGYLLARCDLGHGRCLHIDDDRGPLPSGPLPYLPYTSDRHVLMMALCQVFV